MSGMIRGLAVGALLTLLAACGGGSDAAKPAAAVSGPAPAAFASVVARDGDALKTAYGRFQGACDTCSYDGIYTGLSAVSEKVSALAGDLRAVGSPPTEIAALVASTQAALVKVSTAETAFGACLDTAHADGVTDFDTTPCPPILSTWEAAIKDVVAQLPAWRPYGA
jgi:hypothetical protein